MRQGPPPSHRRELRFDGRIDMMAQVWLWLRQRARLDSGQVLTKHHFSRLLDEEKQKLRRCATSPLHPAEPCYNLHADPAMSWLMPGMSKSCHQALLRMQGSGHDYVCAAAGSRGCVAICSGQMHLLMCACPSHSADDCQPSVRIQIVEASRRFLAFLVSAWQPYPFRFQVQPSTHSPVAGFAWALCTYLPRVVLAGSWESRAGTGATSRRPSSCSMSSPPAASWPTFSPLPPTTLLLRETL